MGIPPENIDITVKYENNVVKVDAKVIWKNGQPVTIFFNGEKIQIPNWFVFECNRSQRMDQWDLQQYIDQSETWCKIIDNITQNGNPFTIYVIQKTKE
jgi:hypothetical protein